MIGLHNEVTTCVVITDLHNSKCFICFLTSKLSWIFCISLNGRVFAYFSFKETSHVTSNVALYKLECTLCLKDHSLIVLLAWLLTQKVSLLECDTISNASGCWADVMIMVNVRHIYGIFIINAIQQWILKFNIFIIDTRVINPLDFLFYDIAK